MEQINYIYLGKLIKENRKNKKLTQQELANAIDKTESSIRKYEKGLVQIPNEVLEKLAKIFEIPFSEMLLNAIENYIPKTNFIEEINSILEEHGYKLIDVGDGELELINSNNYISDTIDKNKLINFYKEKKGNITFEDILMFSSNEEIRERDAFTQFIETLGYSVEANEEEGFIKITDSQSYFEMDIEDYEKLINKMEKFINMELSDYESDVDDLITEEIIEEIKGKVGFYGEQLEKPLTKLEEKIWERYKELHINDKD